VRACTNGMTCLPIAEHNPPRGVVGLEDAGSEEEQRRGDEEGHRQSEVHPHPCSQHVVAGCVERFILRLEKRVCKGRSDHRSPGGAAPLHHRDRACCQGSFFYHVKPSGRTAGEDAADKGTPMPAAILQRLGYRCDDEHPHNSSPPARARHFAVDTAALLEGRSCYQFV
jgi:hypothetical protein